MFKKISQNFVKSPLTFLPYLKILVNSLWHVCISRQKYMLGYSLEGPHQGTSNEYSQHMFSMRNKKNISVFWLKKAPYQDLCDYNSHISTTARECTVF